MWTTVPQFIYYRMKAWNTVSTPPRANNLSLRRYLAHLYTTLLQDHIDLQCSTPQEREGFSETDSTQYCNSKKHNLSITGWRHGIWSAHCPEPTTCLSTAIPRNTIYLLQDEGMEYGQHTAQSNNLSLRRYLAHLYTAGKTTPTHPAFTASSVNPDTFSFSQKWVQDKFLWTVGPPTV